MMQTDRTLALRQRVIEQKTECRWRCLGCGFDISDIEAASLGELPQDFPLYVNAHQPEGPTTGIEMFRAGIYGRLDLVVSFPLERGHRRWVRRAVHSGHHTVPCGPVRRVTIDVQELFVEWIMKHDCGRNLP